MQNLSEFEPPQLDDIPLCELNGKLYRGQPTLDDLSQYTNAVERHPQLHVTRDSIHHESPKEARALFMPVDEPLLKRLIQAYYDRGLLHTLHTLADARNATPTLTRVAARLLQWAERWERARAHFAFTPLEGDTLMANCAQTRNWFSTPIRCIAWDTYAVKMAVATCDDYVRVYASRSAVVPLLRCAQQRKITAMEWRPLSDRELAIACESGVLIWSVDSTSVVTRLSMNNTILLQRVDHRPVLSLAWNPQGDLLFTAAANDGALLVWNVEMDQTSTLKRPGSHANCLVLPSANGHKMLTATNGVVFRVWDCLTWEAERWELLAGRIQTACWSPCGTTLLFATDHEPIIYALSFIQSEIYSTNDRNRPNKATPIYDVSKGDLDGQVVGGCVQSLQWDPHGHYLAAIFRDTNFIAIFIVNSKPVTRINPHYLINGTANEFPCTIQFQKNCEFGACLTIAWSSGRLQHFPMIYNQCRTP